MTGLIDLKPSDKNSFQSASSLPRNELEGCSLSDGLPAELLFDVVERVLAEYIHSSMSNDKEPEWDPLRVLLQVHSVWRNISGKMISAFLGIDRDEAGNLQSNPWHPLRTMHNWGVLSRTGTISELNYDTLRAEHEFLQKSLILSTYLMYFCASAHTRSVTTLYDLADCWSSEGVEHIWKVCRAISVTPRSRLLNIACVYIGHEVFLALMCEVVACWLLYLPALLYFVEHARLEGNLAHNRIEEIVGASKKHHWDRVAAIETIPRGWASSDVLNIVDPIIPLSRDHIKKILELEMKKIEPRLNRVTNEEDEAFRFSDIWSKICRLTDGTWNITSAAPGVSPFAG